MIRLGLSNEATFYANGDMEEGEPREGSSPSCVVEYRDPTTVEQLKFNAEYLAASQLPQEQAHEVGAVLYRCGADLVTGGREMECPPDMETADAIRQFGYHLVVQVAQLAFLRGRAQVVDLGKRGGSPRSGSATGSAESSGPTAKS